MKNKYLIKIKGLTLDEQTQFIYSNLKDNLYRIRFTLILLFFIEVLMLILLLIPGTKVFVAVDKKTYFYVFFVTILYILLFVGLIYFMKKHLKENLINAYRIIILTGLMLLLFSGMAMQIISDTETFQPSIYILMLFAVSVVPFFSYWEIIAVILPSQIFLTVFAITNNLSNTGHMLHIMTDTWGFVILALFISSLFYTDRIRYFKQDLQLKKQNDMLKIHSEIDALTNVYNRRKLDDTMEIEWKRSSRTGKPFAFMLIDLDNFKLYNDTYGHIEGDLCLRKSAAIMKKTLKRQSDEIFRYGGEEFGVILPFTDLKSAQIVAERLRKSIEAAGIVHKAAQNGFLTVSIGYTAATGEKNNKFKDMYIEADKALYAAKRSGRNKVLAFEK